MYSKDDIERRIREIESEMNDADFWIEKGKAQDKIKELNLLKEALSGLHKYDKGNAVMTIFSGAGGDDSEDFSRMLLQMYVKFADRKGFTVSFIHENKNDHGGYRNVTIEITGKNVYGTLKNESGVHRLVRISPFNAKKLRHTSFSLVEVIPEFDEVSADDIKIPKEDIRVEFSRSSGPGGQNVNKRETAVRVIHLPTNMAVHVETERSQQQNERKAIEILKGKLYKKMEDDRKRAEAGLYVSKSTDIEWGNQIRSYVLHPYKLVKDHRTDCETALVSNVLEEGELDAFIEAEKDL